MNRKLFNQAVADARKYPHSSRLHADAMTILYRLYRASHAIPELNPTLAELWDWIGQNHPAFDGRI